MSRIVTYNKKAFLLPGSINSAAIYHALIEESGIYRFRIHDCRSAIRLHGDLTDPEQVEDAIDKLQILGNAVLEFAHFIQMNYQTEQL
jgi:hypothetical protein